MLRFFAAGISEREQRIAALLDSRSLRLLQAIVDDQNAEFWNELCGTGLARSLGITDHSPDSLRRFDEAYIRTYPYLKRYVAQECLYGKRVLEIGLGYGTLGQMLASRGCRYYGLDIAENPIELMRYRLSLIGQDSSRRIQQGSALSIQHRAETFDYVYSVGCLHHTGDLGRAIAEVYRVLKPGGKAVVMLYNRHSFRQLTRGLALRLRGAFSRLSKRRTEQHVRAFYDTNSKGEAAPYTEYVSKAAARRLFADFRNVRIDSQNFDTLVLFGGKLVIQRERFLTNMARVVGLDLYIQAVK
jgi:SAM-dependent methyltransferase